MSNSNGNSNGHGLPPVRGGRPRLLSPEVCARIVAMVAQGNHLRVAAKACGTSLSTLQRWRQRYRRGDPEAADLGEFWGDLKRASALGEAALLSQIEVTAAAGTWQAAAWILERRWPARWARRDVLEVRGAAKDLEGLSDEDLKKLHQRSRRHH
jgi:transposase-like protein